LSEPLTRRERRRAAIIATVVTLPLVLVVALLLDKSGSGSGGSSSSPAALAPVTVSAPASSDARTVSTCANVISALPLVLGGQDVRRTVSDPASPSIVAWGDPAIVLRCGVDRPASLKPNSGDFLVSVNSVVFLPDKQSDATVFTVIDRAVYLDVTVPTSYAQPPLGPIATAIAKVLKPVCQAQSTGGPLVPTKNLCTHRP
jgi:hypothetical protein